MASIASEARLSLAFVERQVNLSKRYWGWELVWLVYGLVNTLAITYIAKQVEARGGAPAETSRLVFFLLIGTLVWAHLSTVFYNIGWTVAWERWEGTIEHTLMAPVARLAHLMGMAAFAVVHGLLRMAVVFGVALLFFDVDFSQSNFPAAAMVLIVGSVSMAGLAIIASVLPLLYPERGEEMTMIAQMALLLVSGVYYSVEVLPQWLQVVAAASPATYALEGIRDALLDGASLIDLLPTLGILTFFGAITVPLGLVVFSWGEAYAKRTGRLKRTG